MMNEGQKFGDFEILARLGVSGTGIVYKARQVSKDRLVALKTLRASLVADPEYMARFFRDAKIATELSHPDIVQVHMAGETDGVHWLATEYVEGTTAEARLKRKGRLAIPEALAIATHVATVLDYGWRKARLIHRDVEPDTIFLSKKSEVKLRGLGLAKSAGEMQTIKMNGSPMGATHYMSPEQAEGKKDTDLRADIYSLGCTLFHFISGTPPYDGDTAMAVILKHVTAPVPELHRLCPDCPAEISRVVMKMMHKQPTGRHQSYAELIADLRGCYEALTGPPAPAPAAVTVAMAAPAKEVSHQRPAVPVKPIVVHEERVSEERYAVAVEENSEDAAAAGKRRSWKKPVAFVSVPLVGVVAALIWFAPWKKPELSEAERAELQRAAQKGSDTSKSPGGSKLLAANITPISPKPTAAPKRSTPTPTPRPSAPATPPPEVPAPEAPASPPGAPAMVAGQPAVAPADTTTAQTPTGKWIAEQEPKWQAMFETEVTVPFERGVGELRKKYIDSIEAQLAAVTQAGSLDAAVAFRAERARINGGGKVPDEDESMAPPALRTMRVGYRAAFAKFDTERIARAKSVHARIDALLAQSQAALTQRQRIEEALEIKARREVLAIAWLPQASAAPEAPATPPPTTPLPTMPVPGPTVSAPPATKGPRLKPRELVGRLIEMGAIFSVGQPGYLTPVGKLEDLPGDKFGIMKVELNKRDGMSEADLEILEQLSDLEELQLNGVPASDATLKLLRGLPSLHVLGMRNLGTLTTAGFKSVAAIPSLKTLNVRGGLSPENLSAIATAKKLDTLNLNDTKFTEQQFGIIASIPALKSLGISTTELIPAAAWTRLTTCKKLATLTVENTPKSAEAIAHISRIGTLTSLSLGDVTLPDTDLAPLGSLKLLQTLRTGPASNVDGSFLYTWAPHNAMKTFALKSTRSVSDKVLRIISTTFPKLDKLELRVGAGSVTSAGFAHLQKLRGIDELMLSGDGVDSAVLAHIATLDQLKRLSLGGARLTEADVPVLAKLGSLRELEWVNPPVSDLALKGYGKLRTLASFKIGAAAKQEVEEKLTTALRGVKIVR